MRAVWTIEYYRVGPAKNWTIRWVERLPDSSVIGLGLAWAWAHLGLACFMFGLFKMKRCMPPWNKTSRLFEGLFVSCLPLARISTFHIPGSTGQGLYIILVGQTTCNPESNLFIVDKMYPVEYVCYVGVYRAEKKSYQILLSSTQAGPGRKVQQEQEENSRNHVPRLFLGSVQRGK